MNPDTQWSTQEKLAIASYVFHTGDEHWTGKVSRLLRPLGDPNRPPDWFSPKHCAQQYTALVAGVESSRRKRPERSDSSDSITSTLQVSTPSVSELVLRKATNERIEELKKIMKNERMKYKKITQTIEQLESGELDDELDNMYDEMQKQIGQDQELLAKISATERLIVPSIPEEKAADEIVQFEKLASDTPNVLPQTATETSQEFHTVTETEEIDRPESPTLDEAAENQPLPQKDSKQIEDSAFSLPKPASQPSVEKEDTVSPATSSSRTLPTPTPVIESDSSSEEEIEMESVTTKDDDFTQTIAMEVDTLSTPIEEQSLIQQSIDSSINSSQSQEILKPNADAAEHIDELEFVESFTSQAAEAEITKSPDQTTESTVDIHAMEEPDSSEEQALILKTESTANKTTATLDNVVETESKEPTEPSIKASASIDLIPDVIPEDETKVEKPYENLNEISDLHKNLDDEKTEDEADDYGSSVSSTPAYIESFPNSPALSTASDADPEVTAQSRAWKKSIVILWKQVSSHRPYSVDVDAESLHGDPASDIIYDQDLYTFPRYASLFLHPVTNEIAPNYSSIVLRPMDLSTLKRNVENGLVRTTSEFQRDLMLMFQNALMYNNCEHDVYKMTQDMQKDVMDQVQQFLTTQLMMETTKQQVTSKGLRRSTLRKSVVPVTEKTSKRAAEGGEARLAKK